MAKVLVIPDLQYPFAHPNHMEFLEAVAKKYDISPKKKDCDFICLGDEIDFHALSDWDTNSDGYSAGHELELALDCMHRLYASFPKMKVCTSNHTVRPFKRAFKAGIPRKLMRDYKEFLEAPKDWEWRDYWIIDDVRYEHGEGVSGMYAHSKAAAQNMRSTVIGHIHSFAGIQYIACHDRLIFGFNAGCLIDNHTYAFAYGKKVRNKPILGCGVIINGIPSFIPMIVDKRNRWTKKI